MFLFVLYFSIMLSTINCSFFTPTPEDENTLPLFKTSQLSKINETPANFKVAFIGDSGSSDGFESVLNLIKEEKAEITVHAGDMSYSILPEGPLKWNMVVNKVLGTNYPYIMTIGNHDTLHWHRASWGYVTLFKKRLAQIKDLHCYVESKDKQLGVKSFCEYKGIIFILSGVGTKGDYHPNFTENVLNEYKDKTWKICTWHKNQKDMQVGSKVDETGWESYKICNKYGAIIATGHEHSYARTKTLTDIGNKNKNHGAIGKSDNIELAPYKNFAFVSGLGGKSIRPYNCNLGGLKPWWASIYTSNYIVKNEKILKPLNCFESEDEKISDDIKYGVLFITFNYEGKINKAKGEFITTDGEILDEFIITKS